LTYFYKTIFDPPPPPENGFVKPSVSKNQSLDTNAGRFIPNLPAFLQSMDTISGGFKKPKKYGQGYYYMRPGHG
jgi:hypothetical protein